MGLFNVLPIFGRNKENIALEHISRLLDIAVKTVEALETYFDALEDGKKDILEEKRDVILKYENDADSYVRSIEELLYSGAFLPISRSRIIDFVDNVDNLIDASKDAVSISQNLIERKYDIRIVKLLKNLAADGVEAAKLLKEAYESLRNGSSDTKEIIQRIRMREMESDQYKGRLYNLLYELNDPMLLFMVAGIGNAVAEICDAAENASDTLNIMLLTGVA